MPSPPNRSYVFVRTNSVAINCESQQKVKMASTSTHTRDASFELCADRPTKTCDYIWLASIYALIADRYPKPCRRSLSMPADCPIFFGVSVSFSASSDLVIRNSISSLRFFARRSSLVANAIRFSFNSDSSTRRARSSKWKNSSRFYLTHFVFNFVIQQNELITRQSSQLANVEWFRATKFAYKYVQRAEIRVFSTVSGLSQEFVKSNEETFAKQPLNGISKGP